MSHKATYDVIGLIHEGGMGAVYEVRHRQLDERRALKVLKPHLAGDPEFQQRFLREARAAIRLKHDGITQVYDFAQDEQTGFGFLIMELVPGGTLKALVDLLKQVPLDLALHLALEALQPLAFLHAEGYVHRDISPDNFMVMADHLGRPKVKLIDLGVIKSQADTQLTVGGAFLGKFLFSAPERFGAVPGDRAESDLYSFGLILYLLLTGQLPFSGSDPAAIVAAQLREPPLPFELSDPEYRVPQELRLIVLKLLAKDPDDRFPSAEATIAALAAVQRGHPFAARDLRTIVAGIRRRARPLGEEGQDRLIREAVARTFSSRIGTELLLPQESAPAASPLEVTQLIPRLQQGLPPRPAPPATADALDAITKEMEIPSGLDLPWLPEPPSVSPTVPPRPRLAPLEPASAPPPAPPGLVEQWRTNTLRGLRQLRGGLGAWLGDLYLNLRQQLADAEWRGELGKRIRPRTLYLAGAILAAAAAAATGVYWARAGDQPAPPPPTIDPTPLPPPAEAVPPPPAPELRLGLIVTQDHLRQGRLEEAQRSFETVMAGRDERPFNADEEALAAELGQFLRPVPEPPAPPTPEEEALAALLARAVREGRLSSALEAAAALRAYEREHPESAALDDTARRRFRRIAQQHAALDRSRAGRDWPAVLAGVAELRKSFPVDYSLMQAEESAAAAIEAEAELLAGQGDVAGANARLEELTRFLPARPGIGEKIAGNEFQVRWQDLQRQVRQLAENGRPKEALALLGASGPPGLAVAGDFRQLENEVKGIWVSLDQGAPRIAITVFSFLRGQDAKLELAISDDLEAESAVAWVRPQARLMSPKKYSRLELTYRGAERWLLTIPSAIHDNRAAIEIYVEAFDHHHNRGQLGSPNQPLVFRREE
jgi:serine/threonine protein kinase